MSEQTRTITLDGESYELTQFSDQVQQAVAVYNTFTADLQKEQLAVLKTKSAIEALGAQIAKAVRDELDAKKPAEEAAPAAE